MTAISTEARYLREPLWISCRDWTPNTSFRQRLSWWVSVQKAILCLIFQ